MKTAGFKITDKKGFHMTFENGWTVSVQWGPGNYCDNYNMPMLPIGSQEAAGELGSATAECAAWGSDGEMVDLPGHNDKVTNRSSPQEVLALLCWAANQPMRYKEND